MEVKKCYKCKKEKRIVDFANNKSRPDGKNSQCRKCQAVYRREHYLKNKDLIKHQTKIKKEQLKLWFENLKSKLKCSNCEESRWWVLDFHHLNPKNKEMNVSSLLSCGSKKRILKEIDKCDVLCSNCHRDLHYQEKVGNA